MKKFIIALFVLSAGFVLATDYDIYVEAGVNEPQFIMQVPVGSTDTVTFNIMNDGVPITATNYTAKMYIDFDDSFGSARTITLTGSTSGSAATFTMTGPVIYSGLNNWYVRVEMGTTYFIDGKLQIDATPLANSGQSTAIATMAAIPSSVSSVTTYGIGASNTTNVTSAVENGDGVSHQTVITLNGVASAIADGGFEASQLLYTFPEGLILVDGVTCDITCTMATTNFNASTDDLYNFALGTAENDDGDGTISATGANLIANQSIDTVAGQTQTNTVGAALSASAQFDGTTTARVMYLNWGVPSANDNGANTNAFTGTITVTWKDLGDY